MVYEDVLELFYWIVFLAFTRLHLYDHFKNIIYFLVLRDILI